MAMNANTLEQTGNQETSLKELVLRQRMMKDAIFVYGLMIAVIAGACGLLIYFNL